MPLLPEAEWLTATGVRVLLILGGAYVLTRILRAVIGRLHKIFLPRAGTAAESAEQEKRVATIERLLQTLTTVVLMSLAGLVALHEVGVDVTPILTGAGIAGLAVGFGAQNLVRDVIAGILLILEDQVRVGDVVNINGRGGLVEDIGLRTIRLRDFDGAVHVIANGAINELSNLTTDYSYYVIDLGVAYKENVDRVMGVLREVGREFEADPAYAPKILAPLEIVGVDAFADSAVILKLRIKTLPREQWNVGRELRRRIKNAFDAGGIEIPFPHLALTFSAASKPVAVQLREQTGPDRVK
jgi:small conductance mechanosensitive channel